MLASALRPSEPEYGAPRSIVKFDIRLTCTGADGKVKWTDARPTPPVWWNNVSGALLLTLVCAIALALRRPELFLFAPMRVVTSGLNLLLDATIKTGQAAPTWYIGLIKANATDGAMTAASATLTSASNPFAAGDVGRQIIVRGAGAAGGDLSTTIQNFGSAGSVTLANAAGTTVGGAAFAFEPRLTDTMAAHSFQESTAYSNATRPTFTPGAIANGSVDNSASVGVFNINNTDFIFGAFLANASGKGAATGTLYGGGMNASGIARQVASGDTLNVTVTPSITSA